MRWLALALLSAGCGSEARFEAPEAADFDGARVAGWSQGGCGDVDLYLRNADDSRAVFVNLYNLATESHQAGHTIVRSWDLPSSEVGIHAQMGRRLTSATCVGAFPFPGPQVNRYLVAESGHVNAVVVPDPNGSPFFPMATAYAEMTDLELVDPTTGATLVIPRLVVSGVGVGFYPP